MEIKRKIANFSRIYEYFLTAEYHWISCQQQQVYSNFLQFEEKKKGGRGGGRDIIKEKKHALSVNSLQKIYCYYANEAKKVKKKNVHCM